MVWQVLVVAAVIVISTVGLMFIVQNDETVEAIIPQSGQFTYEVLGNEEPGIKGIITLAYRFDEVSGWMGVVSTAGKLPAEAAAVAFMCIGSYQKVFGDIAYRSDFGVKHAYRTISSLWGPGMEMGAVIAYRGAESSLAYRMDLVTPEYRYTFNLASTNFTEIEYLDTGWGQVTTHHRETMELIEDYSWNFYGGSYDGLYDPGLVHVDQGREMNIRITSHNYSVFIWTMADIQAMVDGGPFQYDQARSKIGSGVMEWSMEGETLYISAIIEHAEAYDARLDVTATVVPPL